MKRILFAATVLTASVVGCGPRIQPLRPIMQNGAVLPPADAAVAEARAESRAEQAQIAGELDAATETALASCSPVICDALARGELALGMNQAQVLAATGSTADAWQVRGRPEAMVMSARPGAFDPADAVGRIAYVSLRDGQVSSYTYQEPHGLRTVASSREATAAGRVAAQAAALLREGDDYAVAGELDRALDRYDRADVIRPNNPEITLRIAQVLDKQLRPIEAIVRYQMFIHQMELERIRARGEVAANIAEAIARAHERIIVLERQR